MCPPYNVVSPSVRQVKPHKTFAKGKGATGVGSGGEDEADADDALTKTIPRTKLVKVVQVCVRAQRCEERDSHFDRNRE